MLNMSYAFISLIGSIISLAAVIYITFRRFGDKISRTFIWILLLCFLWSVSIYFMRSSPDEAMVFLWAKIRYIVLLLLPAVLTYLASIFPAKASLKDTSVSIALLLFTLIAFIPSTLILLFNNQIVTTVESGWWGYHAVVGDGYFVFMFYFLVLMGYVIFSLVRGYFNLERSVYKKQTLWLLFVSLLMVFIETLEASFKITDLYLFPLNDILLLPVILGLSYIAIEYRTFPD